MNAFVVLILERNVDIFEIVLFFASGLDDWNGGFIEIGDLFDELLHLV